jgi:hypothetical protein
VVYDQYTKAKCCVQALCFTSCIRTTLRCGILLKYTMAKGCSKAQPEADCLYPALSHCILAILYTTNPEVHDCYYKLSVCAHTHTHTQRQTHRQLLHGWVLLKSTWAAWYSALIDSYLLPPEFNLSAAAVIRACSSGLDQTSLYGTVSLSGCSPATGLSLCLQPGSCSFNLVS